MMATVELHDVKILSNKHCWSLFAQHAFANTNIDANPNLVSIGKKIVEKCKGLPLAARTLGGLLRNKVRDEEWCFAYCSIIPNNYEFEEEELVLLWMAEGFFQQQKEKQMEDVGAEYFHELLSRSFFQPSRTSKFVMHDLINDLSQVVARDTCFRMEDRLKDQDQYKNLKKARHSSYMQQHYEGADSVEELPMGIVVPGYPVHLVIVRYPHVHFDQSWGNIALGKLMFRMFKVSQFHRGMLSDFLY
ncbi:hypothetical protein ACSBR1_017032 [Camellia fascicularis]